MKPNGWPIKKSNQRIGRNKIRQKTPENNSSPEN